MKKLLSSKIARASIFLSAGNYFALGIGVLTQFWVAKVLGVYEYGVVAIALAYPSLVYSITTPKSGSVLTRYIVEYESSGKSENVLPACLVSYSIDCVAVVMAMAALLLTGHLVQTDGYEASNIYRLILTYTLSLPFLAITNTSLAIANGYEKYRYLAFIQIARRVFFLPQFLLFTSLIDSKSYSLILTYTFSNVVYGCMCLFLPMALVFKSSKHNPSKHSVITHIRSKLLISESKSFVFELLKNHGWNFLLVTISGLVTQLPILFLGSVKGPEQAGFFRFGTLLASSASHPNLALKRTLLPKLTREIKQQSSRQLNRIFRRWTVRFGLSIGCLVLLGGLMLYPVIDYFYGAEYIAVFSGFYLLMSGTALITTFFWLEPYYFAQAKYKAFTMINGVGLIIFCLLAFGPADSSGFVWICLTDFVYKLCLTLMLLAFLRKERYFVD
ncbi:MAG: hypothetical protein AAFY78_04695 [Cyanobacteria bacterium J06648_16]